MAESKVYFSDMRAHGQSLLLKLKRLMKAAGFENIDFAGKFVAVKIHFGEPGNLAYLRPNWAGVVCDYVKELGGKPFLTDCNTLYVGGRKNALDHLDSAYKNGYNPFQTGVHTIIADGLKGTDEALIPVEGGVYVKEAKIGRALADADIIISLSHFKGHAMAGFGGAIKNISIGLGSRMGKCWIHSGGTSKTNPWGGEQIAFLESMADAGKSVVEHLGRENIAFINVLNRISIDCDCNGNPAEPDIHDIGILASTDPVAVDQAGIDMVSVADGNEALMNRIAERQGLHTLEAAEQIGLGSRTYELVDLDK